MRKIQTFFLFLACLIFTHLDTYAQAGANDNAFNTPDTFYGFNGLVRAVVTQPDGKILVGGDFTKFNGIDRPYIARLNPDGTLDNTFLGYLNNSVYAIDVEADGNIIIGGDFTEIENYPANKIARLNIYGTLELTLNVGDGFNAKIRCLKVLGNGRILVGGDFTTFNGQPKNRLLRLRPDGLLESSFNANFNNIVQTLTIQSNNQILVGGYFGSVNNLVRNNIVRLNSDGSVDTGFNIGTGFNSNVNTMAITKTGSIIVGGGFSTYNGVAKNKIVSLRPDGTVDPIFNTSGAYNTLGFSPEVKSIVLQNNDKILVGGSFNNFAGQNNTGIIRLQQNGALDTSFTGNQPIIDSTPFYTLDTNVNVCVIITQSNKIIVGGQFFPSVGFEEMSREYLMRINEDGFVDDAFCFTNGFNGKVNVVVKHPNNKIVVGGNFTRYNNKKCYGIVRLNQDGSIDNTFDSGIGFDLTPDNQNTINAIAIQNINGEIRIIVGGEFTQYNDNGYFQPNLIALRPDGNVDEDFNIGNGFNDIYMNPNVYVNSIAVDQQNKIVVGGNFNNFNNTNVINYFRLEQDGSLDANFSFSLNNQSINNLIVQPDNKIVLLAVVGNCILVHRINANGITVSSTGGLYLGQGAIVGEVQVEKLVKQIGNGNTSVFRYLSSPLQNTQVGQFIDNTSTHNETNITSTNPNLNLIDGWANASNLTTLLPNKGYRTSQTNSIQKKYVLTGLLNVDNEYQISITKQNGSNQNYGLNLLGNPYLSQIDLIKFWNSANNQNIIEKKTWIPQDGNFTTLAQTSSGSVIANNITIAQNEYSVYSGISIMQGFFVKAITNGNVKINKTMTGYAYNLSYSKPVNEQTNANTNFQMLRLKLTNEKVSDEMLIYNEEVTPEKYGAEKLDGNKDKPYLASFRGQDWSILAVEKLKNGFSATLSVRANGKFSFRITEKQLLDENVYLFDRKTNIIHDLKKEYTFEGNGTENNRFVLYIGEKSTPEQFTQNDISVKIWANENVLFVKFATEELAKNAQMTITNVQGQNVKTYNNLEVETRKIPNLDKGVYIIKLQQAKGTTIQKVVLE